METIEQFTQEHYKSFMNIYNYCNIQDKASLFILRSINIIITLFILFGCLVPKKILIWHLLLCFLVFIFLEFPDFNFINNYTYQILERNNKDNLSSDKLKLASNLLPMKKQTMKSVLVIVSLISLFGYMYKHYSANNILKNIQDRMEIEISPEEINYNIITEFKSGPSKNKINDSYKLVTNNTKVVPLHNEFNAPLTELNINSSIVDLNNNGLSIFNKIKPINVETIKVPTPNKIIESDINVNLLKFDKTKILKSLQEFIAL
jgi:hypothetical protein